MPIMSSSLPSLYVTQTSEHSCLPTTFAHCPAFLPWNQIPDNDKQQLTHLFFCTKSPVALVTRPIQQKPKNTTHDQAAIKILYFTDLWLTITFQSKWATSDKPLFAHLSFSSSKQAARWYSLRHSFSDIIKHSNEIEVCFFDVYVHIFPQMTPVVASLCQNQRILQHWRCSESASLRDRMKQTIHTNRQEQWYQAGLN